MSTLLVSLWIRDMCNHVTDQWVTSLMRLVIIVMCVSISSMGMVDRGSEHYPRNRCFPSESVCPSESHSILRLDHLLTRSHSLAPLALYTHSLFYVSVSVLGAHVADA